MTNHMSPAHVARIVNAKRQRPAGSTRFVEVARSHPRDANLAGCSDNPARVNKLSVAGLNLAMTQHARNQIVEKGLDQSTVLAAFNNPERVYPSGSHPGQIRVTGSGVCLVGVIENGEFRVITVYQDGVLTAPRADQLNTPEGRRYAQRYAANLGRG